MFGALAGALTGIIGAVMQAQAMHEQNVMNYENLQFQKDNASKQYDLSTASRSDVYGDKEKYNKALNQWETSLTPQQKQIIDALQKEQNLSLTEDADRARNLRRRQDVRSKEAGGIYHDLVGDFRYHPPKSEGAAQDEAVTDQLLAHDDRLKSSGGDLARLAVRSGQDPSALAGIVKAIADQRGAGLGEDILKGKAQGRANYAADRASYNAKLDPIKFFEGVSDDISGFTPTPSGTPDWQNNAQRDMLSAISGALTNQSSQVGGAYQTLAKSLGMSAPDLGGIASALSGLGNLGMESGGTSSFSAPIVPPYSSGGSGGIFDDPYKLNDRVTQIPTVAGFPG